MRHLAAAAFVLLVAACKTDSNERPDPDTSQGEEFGNPQAEEAASSAFEPIDPNTPEERTPTVTSPPETPPPPEPGPPPGPERAAP
jgi:hypothetical protein